MDNILKLLLGVLSVAGLIAMVTPTNLTVEPATPAIVEAPTVAIGPPSEDASNGLPPEEEAIENVGDDPFDIGEPTIDGNPINQEGTQNNTNSETPQPQVPAFDPASYAVPGMTNYAPPPVYNVPIGADGFANVPSTQ